MGSSSDPDWTQWHVISGGHWLSDRGDWACASHAPAAKSTHCLMVVAETKEWKQISAFQAIACAIFDNISLAQASYLAKPQSLRK